MGRPRQTHCTQGHEYTPENTYVPPNGRRYCRTCRRENARRYYAKVVGRNTGVRNRDKTHCKNGHEFTEENTYRRPDNGTRQCVACRAEQGRRQAAKRKTAPKRRPVLEPTKSKTCKHGCEFHCKKGCKKSGKHWMIPQ